MKISYTKEAVADLQRLREFIEIKNPTAAKRIASELLQAINKLNDFPEIGLQVEHAPNPQHIRDLFVSDYTIRYLLNSNNIVILRLWHGKELKVLKE